jgi:hypothetical protein
MMRGKKGIRLLLLFVRDNCTENVRVRSNSSSVAQYSIVSEGLIGGVGLLP